MPRKSLFAIASAQFVAVVGFSILPPLLPGLMRTVPLSPVGAAVIVAVYLGAAAAGGVVLLRLSRRWGRKPVLVGAGLLAAEGLLALAWAGDVPMLVVARLASGFASGAAVVAGASALDVSDGRRERARALRAMAVAVALGLIAGPLLVAVLGRAGGSVPALASAVLAAGGLLAVIAMVPETVPPAERGRRQHDRGHRGRALPT